MKSLNTLGNMKGRVVLITGGAGQIGMAMGESLAEAGAQVIVLDMDKALAEKAASRLESKFALGHIGLAVDLADKAMIASVPSVIDNHFGKLDVLINCAALVGSSKLKGWTKPFKDQDVSTWEKALEVNLTGAFYLIQQCHNLMEKAEAPSIINVSSIYGFAGQKMSLYDGMDYLTPAAYAASKGGLIQLTRYLATVFAPRIRVNCISPGGIEQNQDENFIKRYEQMTPLARMGRVDDFIGVTHFLSSDLSAYITGQNIIVDGGWSL